MLLAGTLLCLKRVLQRRLCAGAVGLTGAFPGSIPVGLGLPPRPRSVPAFSGRPGALPAGRGLHALNRVPAALPAARRREPRGCARRRTAASEPPGRPASGESSCCSPRNGDARERSPAPSARRGPPAAARPLLGGAGRAERPGPAAAPASASSPSVPCLLPPPGGRLRGAGGREGAAERCCWKGSLKKVAGCPGAPAASWRSRASRRSTSSSPSRRPPPRPSAGPSAGTPTSCRRLSVSGAGGVGR